MVQVRELRGGVEVGGLAFALVMTALFPTGIAMAQQQASYWTLTVYLHAKFGWSSVYVEAKGPFGAIKSGWFVTGVGAYATLYLPLSDYPSGYYYTITVTGPGLTDLPSTWTATSTGQDQTYTYEYNEGGNSLTGG